MYSKIDEAKRFFDSDKFLLDFYNSAIKSFDDSLNSLRLSNFACNIRELLREKMAIDAPEQDILKCSWCKNSYLDDKGKPTRKARIRYYLLSNMNNTDTEKIFETKIEDIEKEYVSVVSKLNKYTHVTRETFYLSNEEIQRQFNEVLDLLIFIINFINASEKLTLKKIEEFLFNDITKHIYNDYIDSDLDILSTHTRIEDVSGIEFSIQKISKNHIFIKGTAVLDVNLQYGSYSEIRRGDGTVFYMDFDLNFSVKININDLHEKEYKYEPINTDKFYEIKDL